MSTPRTFAILKPHNPVIQQKIIGVLIEKGFKIVRQEIQLLDIDVLREHYAHHVEKDFFPPMAEYMTSGPSILLILERVNEFDPVEQLQKLAGKTDPKKGVPGELRYDFGLHYHDPEHPGWVFYNAIHCSDPGEVEIEIARFFPNP